MKRALSVVIIAFMIVSLFSLFIGNVKAESSAEPYAKGVGFSGGFTTQVIAEGSLPGTAETLSGMKVPAGFPLGENKFGGSGLAISGLKSGVLNVCFPMTGYQYGWGGKVGQWTGSKWKLLSTTITTPEESNISWACASTSSNGSYAFITWIADFAKLHASGLPSCGYGITDVHPDFDAPPTNHDTFTTAVVIKFTLYATTDLTGKVVTISVLNPDAGYLNDTVSGTLAEGDSAGQYVFTVDPGVILTTYNTQHTPLSWYANFGTCADAVSFTPHGS